MKQPLDWEKESEDKNDGVMGMMKKLLNPKTLAKMTKDVSQEAMKGMITKRVLVDQATNGYILTFFRGKEEKILCKDLQDVMFKLQRFFEGGE